MLLPVVFVPPTVRDTLLPPQSPFAVSAIWIKGEGYYFVWEGLDMRVLISHLGISVGMQCQTCLSDGKKLVLYEKHYQRFLNKNFSILRTIAYSLNYGLVTRV